MDKLSSLFTSRRVGATVIGILVVILKDLLGLDEQTAMTIAGLLGAWVLGDSIKNTQ